MSEIAQTQSKTDEYWATKSNTDLVPEIVKRRKSFANQIMTSGVLPRINRSWQHFHGIFFPTSGNNSDMAIAMDDSESGDALANINFTRAIVDQHITYVLGEKPAWDARAIQPGSKARKKAILFDQLLDAYMEVGGVDDRIEKWVKYAAVLAGGFMYVSWDWLKGAPIREGFFAGDLSFEVLSLPDVAWDLVNPEAEDMLWFNARTLRNRWDLCKRFPECVDEILEAPPASETQNDYAETGGVGLSYEATDFIVVNEWWHKPTATLPEGRHLAYVSDKDPLVEGDKEEPEPTGIKDLPLIRLVPSEFLLTALGYSFSFDMQVPQEMVGANLSSLINCFNILGQPRIFCHEQGNVRIEDLEPGAGVPVIKGTIKPEELDFNIKLKENADALQFGKGLMGEMAGIGPVSRGDVSEMPKNAPAAALALLDSKSIQSTSIFSKRYRKALSRLGNVALQIIKVHAKEPRLIALAGKKHRGEMIQWSAEDFKDIDCVVVEPGSPLQRSLAGKVQLADSLADRGWIPTPQGYLSVIETGQMEDYTGSVESQLAVISDENERLQEGAETADQLIQALTLAQDPGLIDQINGYLQQIGVVALKTDNHILHARRHGEIIDSTETRMNRGIMIPTTAHQQQHLDFMSDPEIQQQQLLLGYLTPQQLQELIASKQVPLMGMMPGGPPGAGVPPGNPPQGDMGTPQGATGGPQTTPPPVNETGQPPKAPRVPARATKDQIARNLQ